MFTMAFTDAQGVTHPGAVFVVQHAYFSDNRQLQLNYADGVHAPHDYRNYHVAFSARYWPSQDAHDDGRPPYILVDSTGGDTFQLLNLDTPPSTAEELLTAVETYMQNVLLPSMV